MARTKISRRHVLVGGSAALVGCATAKVRPPRFKSPNDKLNVAAIGAGGKGGVDIGACAAENVVALCDVDWKRAAKTFARFPNARRYTDFRQMLDKEKLDAVTISTADHTHAIAAMWAMQRGLAVYLQKPLTHNVMEARVLAEAARKYRVATQMGNQGHAGEGVRQICEIVRAGVIGPVREVHAWTNRPIWPQGLEGLPAQDPRPETLDWDLFLGPAQARPYSAGYTPFKWRGFWDFGCGAFGDMACHILDPANWALELGHPTSVECVQQEGRTALYYPTKSIVKYEFPARGTMPPVTVTWYDGGHLPPRPEGVPEGQVLGDGANGSYFVGEKGILTAGTYGEKVRLLPDERMLDFKFPEPTIARSPGPYQEWLLACKGGKPPESNFAYAGPFTEWVLLGCIAQRVNGKLLWDGARMQFSNRPEANQFLMREPRKGWGLPSV